MEKHRIESSNKTIKISNYKPKTDCQKFLIKLYKPFISYKKTEIKLIENNSNFKIYGRKNFIEFSVVNINFIFREYFIHKGIEKILSGYYKKGYCLVYRFNIFGFKTDYRIFLKNNKTNLFNGWKLNIFKSFEECLNHIAYYINNFSISALLMMIFNDKKIK